MVHNDATIGWLLDEGDRARLLQQIAPAYPQVVAHHVTLKSGAGPGESAPPAAQAAVVGVADDGEGVQALVVSLNGTTARPDGSAYHITWSLAAGRGAIESNSVIAGHGCTPRAPIPIRLVPGRF